ncbi:MAG: hypothetical protein M0P26_07065 [Bacteroidales bacterium]|nr:hypothetical protein [Bacteroidales bacterium]
MPSMIDVRLMGDGLAPNMYNKRFKNKELGSCYSGVIFYLYLSRFFWHTYIQKMKAKEFNSEVDFPENNQHKRKNSVIPYQFHESILLVLWGWLLFLDYFRFYLSKEMMFSYDLRKMLAALCTVVVVSGIIYTIYFLSKRLEKLKTELGKSLLCVWFSAFLCMVMVHLIQQNSIHKVVFELQHCLFMLITAIAIVLTGRLIHNRPVLYGGIFFAVLAFAASYLVLKDQLLLEAIGWLCAFVIPGHILYSKH